MVSHVGAGGIGASRMGRRLWLAGAVLALLASCGLLEAPVEENPPNLDGEWNELGGWDYTTRDLVSARLTIEGSRYAIRYELMCRPSAVDTLRVLRDEAGSCGYVLKSREEATARLPYSPWCDIEWYGALHFTPDTGEPWDAMVYWGYHRGPFTRTTMLLETEVYDTVRQMITLDLLVAPQGAAGWRLARMDRPVDLVADARGDGIERCYGLARDGAAVTYPTQIVIHNYTDTVVAGVGVRMVDGLVESYWSNGGWVSGAISPAGMDLAGEPVVARCRPDRQPRLYVFADSGALYEFEYRGGSWSSQVVHDFGSEGGIPFTEPAHGDLRGIGYESLVLALPGTPGESTPRIVELLYRGGAWSASVIQDSAYGSPSSPVFHAVGEHGMVCADLRGEGRHRLFVVTDEPAVVEYVFVDDSTWGRSVIEEAGERTPGASPVGGLWVLDGQDQCRSLVLVADGVWKLSRSSGGWVTSLITSEGWDYTRVATGPAHNDGVQRVYCTMPYANAVVGYTCVGGAIAENDRVGLVHPGDLIVGAGRGDGVCRIYADDPWGTYELTYTE